MIDINVLIGVSPEQTPAQEYGLQAATRERVFGTGCLARNRLVGGLAVVIGTGSTNVMVEDARRVFVGYTIADDVSARSTEWGP